MKPAPDGDVTPMRTPARSRPPWQSPASRRWCSACCPAGHRLRRPHRPRRCIRPLNEIEAAVVAAGGAIRFDEFMRIALYGEHGFYTTGGQAGRRGDFITSPEVGPLFGAVVARWIQAEWFRLGEPDDFVVIECGAGPGTLARSVLAAAPQWRRRLRRCRGLGAAATATSGRCVVGEGHAAGVRVRRGDRQRTARQPSVSTRCLRRGLARGGRIARPRFRVGRKHHCTRPGMVTGCRPLPRTAHGCPCRAMRRRGCRQRRN